VTKYGRNPFGCESIWHFKHVTKSDTQKRLLGKIYHGLNYTHLTSVSSGETRIDFSGSQEAVKPHDRKINPNWPRLAGGWGGGGLYWLNQLPSLKQGRLQA
jgi:hypothetical protein